MQTDGESGMNTDQLLVDLGDVQGHAYMPRSDAQPILEMLKRLPDDDRIAIRLAPTDDADDVEGHAQSSSVTVLAGPADDDVEGHSISLHFPTAREADAFRRNLMAAGALTGAIVISGAAIALRPAAPATSTGAVVDRPAAVVQMQQQTQHLRDQRLMEVAPAAAAAATTTAPTGGALAGQQSAQQQRDQALGSGGASSGSSETAADDLPTHGGVIP